MGAIIPIIWIIIIFGIIKKQSQSTSNNQSGSISKIIKQYAEEANNNKDYLDKANDVDENTKAKFYYEYGLTDDEDDEDDDLFETVFPEKKTLSQKLSSESNNALVNQFKEYQHLSKNNKSFNKSSKLSKEHGQLAHSHLSVESRDDEKEWFK